MPSPTTRASCRKTAQLDVADPNHACKPLVSANSPACTPATLAGNLRADVTQNAARRALRLPRAAGDPARMGGSSCATAIAVRNAHATMARRAANVSASSATVSTILVYDVATFCPTHRVSPVGRPPCCDDTKSQREGSPEARLDHKADNSRDQRHRSPTPGPQAPRNCSLNP